MALLPFHYSLLKSGKYFLAAELVPSSSTVLVVMWDQLGQGFREGSETSLEEAEALALRV